MSSNVTHAKEPLFRMVKRDAIPQKKAWMIRAAAFLLSLATGAVVIMMLGHNPFSVYISMIKGAWGTKTVSYETIKIAIPLLITAIGISFAFKMKFWNIGAEGQILVGAVAAGAFVQTVDSLQRSETIPAAGRCSCRTGTNRYYTETSA